ncbi:ribonuclease HI, partial [Mycoplasmopsis pullorum]
MSQKKYYVVKVGKVPGIYETWAQTQEQVTKFPNAQYKAFATKDEALDYLNSDFTVEKQDSTNDAIDLEIDNLTDQEVLAFVDGSYTKDSKQQEKYSFGVVLITTKANDYLSRGFENPDYVKFRNVAGEIEGAKEAILWALTNQKSKIKIFHDYEGIAKWPNKEWDAKTEITRNYVDFYEQKKDLIDIQFAHVKSHSGVIFNEEADQLAKNALKSQSYKLHNLTTIYFENVDKETWISLIRDENNWLNSNEIPR